MNICTSCKKMVDEWNQTCGSCGFQLVLEPDEIARARYLRGPSLGALFFTQGWTFGARLYVWFLLSIIPIVGIVVLFVCLFFGRRWSWKRGGWTSWQEFQIRMRVLDICAISWLVCLVGVYFWVK